MNSGSFAIAVVRPKPTELAIVPETPSNALPSPRSAWPAESSPRPTVQEYDKRTDIAVWSSGVVMSKPMTWKIWIESVCVVMMAIIDNVMAYLTFFTIRAFHGRLYNIVDLQYTLLEGIDIALLGFAILGTFIFSLLIILVEALQLSLFHELMNFRLFFSAMPCGIICAILLYHSERTQWAPFATVMAVLCTIVAWGVHMRVNYSNSLNVVSKTSLDISWFMAFVCAAVLGAFFAVDKMEVLTRSNDLNCPFAPNERMPVFVHQLQRWYCAPWDEDHPMLISRAPLNNEPKQLTCSDSFMAAFGISIEPHLVQCPVGCTVGATNVVGCGIYTVDSPICVAAIHVGALTDAGGPITVYGRLGVSVFQGCSRNSIASVDRYVTQSGGSISLTRPTSGGGSSPFMADGGRRLTVTVPTVVDPQGKSVPQAFHFNNDQPADLPQTREYVWLKRYEKVSDENAEDGQPWSQIEATVSLRFAGIELENEKIRIGQTTPQQLFVQPRPGQVFDVRPSECRIGESGVLCQGNGRAVVQLDFCQKEVKECPEE